MVQDGSKASLATGCLSHVGLATLIAFGTLSVLGLTVLLPPWARVRSQRQELLYFSKEVQVYEKTFAGYDWLFAESKWQTNAPRVVASGQFFDVTDYRIYWPLLVAEWVAVGLGAACLFVLLSRRLRTAFRPDNVLDSGDQSG
jgi:hypothetical protein